VAVETDRERPVPAVDGQFGDGEVAASLRRLR
jgi:hypothetical protein